MVVNHGVEDGLASYEKPRNTPSSSTASVKSAQSMFASDRLFSTDHRWDTITRNSPRGSSFRSANPGSGYGTGTTRIGFSADDTRADPLIEDFVALLQAQNADLVATFRSLSDVLRGDASAARSRFGEPEAFDAWAARRDDFEAAVAAHFLARHQPSRVELGPQLRHEHAAVERLEANHVTVVELETRQLLAVLAGGRRRLDDGLRIRALLIACSGAAHGRENGQRRVRDCFDVVHD